MSCGGRIYKGDTVYVSVPFDVEGYSALTISFFTNGEYKITRTEEEVTIEDGFITAVFEGHDLDVLPDGVLRYTIECEVEGEDYVDSSNTMFYLKTPKDYDAADVQDFYNSGWTEGFASGLTEGFPTGYASGYTDGQAEGYASGYTEGYDSGHTTGRSEGWQDGIDWEYTRISQSAITLSFSGNGEWHKDFFSEVFCNGVVVDVPIDEIYQSGYTEGVADGFDSGVTAQKAKMRVLNVHHNGTFESPDRGYSKVIVDIHPTDLSEAEMGIGVYGSGSTIEFHAPYSSDWNHNFVDCVKSIHILEEEYTYVIDEDDYGRPFTWYHIFTGSGYHTVWLTLKADMYPGERWFKATSDGNINYIETGEGDYEPLPNFYSGYTYTPIYFDEQDTDVKNLLLDLLYW